jgi:dipeptidyl aminopeptidase/acylaminoacyl peptidase
LGFGWLREVLSRADDGIKREESLADIAATFDFVGASPKLDATRIGVYGVSYGGYLSLAAATFFPERVKAAVDVIGISSIPTFLAHTQSSRQDLRRAEYGDERDPAVRAVQERISPLASVGRIQAALFVLHGKNDPRVPRSEAEQIVRAVRESGRPVWYLLALNEGHGFAKKENRDLANLAVVAFFETYLR